MTLSIDDEILMALVLSQAVVTVAWLLSRCFGLFGGLRWAIALQLLPPAVSLVAFACFYDYYPIYVPVEDGLVCGTGASSPVRFFIMVLFVWGLVLSVAFAILRCLLSDGWWGWRSLKYPLRNRGNWRKPLDFASTQGVLRYHGTP